MQCHSQNHLLLQISTASTNFSASSAPIAANPILFSTNNCLAALSTSALLIFLIASSHFQCKVNIHCSTFANRNEGVLSYYQQIKHIRFHDLLSPNNFSLQKAITCRFASTLDIVSPPQCFCLSQTTVKTKVFSLFPIKT